MNEKRGQDALGVTLKSFAPAPGKKVNRISWTCTHIVYVQVADTDLGGKKTMEHNLVLVDLKPYHTKFGEDLRQSGLKIVWSCFEQEKTSGLLGHLIM